MSDEEHGTICSIDIVALRRDQLICSLNLAQKMRDEALTSLTNATNDFKKIDDIYWDNQTTKNKEARHKAKIQLTYARKHFWQADYDYLCTERALTRYKQEHDIQEPKEITDEIANALLMVELTKGEYDKARAEYKRAVTEHPDLAQAKKEWDEAQIELNAAKDKCDKASKKWNELEMQFRKEHDVLADAEMNAFEALLKALERIKNIKNKIIGDRI